MSAASCLHQVCDVDRAVLSAEGANEDGRHKDEQLRWLERERERAHVPDGEHEHLSYTLLRHSF